MKAITICQPYAELICRGDKRIENRTWPTMYRGLILIHAGKSREWLTDDGPNLDPRENYGVPLTDMAFGAFVAVARLVNCVTVDSIHAGRYDDIYPWARDHQHAEGPWCWVLQDVQRLANPVPWRGQQGLWDVDYDQVRGVSLEKSA